MQSFRDGEKESYSMNDFGPKHSTPIKARSYKQQFSDYGSPVSVSTHKVVSRAMPNTAAPQRGTLGSIPDYVTHTTTQDSSLDTSPISTRKVSQLAASHERDEQKEASYERCRSYTVSTSYDLPNNKCNSNVEKEKSYNTVMQKQGGTWFVSPTNNLGHLGDGSAVNNMSAMRNDTLAWSPGSSAALLEQDIINKQRHEIQILMEELGTRDQELNDLVTSHQKQVQAWEAEREKFLSLQMRLRNYEEELMKNDRQLKEKLKEMALVSEQREADALEFKRTQDEMEKLAEKISENSHYIQEMEYQNKSLKNTIKELMVEQHNRERREQELMKSIDDKDKLLSEKKVEINQLKDHVKFIETRCEELEEKNINMAAENNSWKRKYCQAKDEADRLLVLNSEKEENNQKMTLQLQESLQQAVALQKALFTSCEREKCKEEVMYSLRKQHKRTMQELQNIRELYDRQNRDLTLYHLSVKEKNDTELGKKESEHKKKPEDIDKVNKKDRGDKNMSSHKDRIHSSAHDSEDSATYLIKNKKNKADRSHVEDGDNENAESPSYQTETFTRSTRHTTRCYNVATTTSSTTQLSEDRDSSASRSRPSTSLGISNTSTWGSSSIQNSSRHSVNKNMRSCSDPRPCSQKRLTRSRTTSPILTRYPIKYRDKHHSSSRSRPKRRSRSMTEAKMEESCCSSPGSRLSTLQYDDDGLSPADSDGMCHELKRDITKICVEAFDISPQSEKNKTSQGAKHASSKQFPSAMLNPQRSSFLKKERVEKRISFSADDEEDTVATALSTSKKSLELCTQKEKGSLLRPNAQGDCIISPTAIENECSHNSPQVVDETSAQKPSCEHKKCSPRYNCCKWKSKEIKPHYRRSDKKSCCSWKSQKPLLDESKPSESSPVTKKCQKPDHQHFKKCTEETKPPLKDSKPPSQKIQKPDKKSSKNQCKTIKSKPKEEKNQSTNGNPNSPSMDESEFKKRNFYEESQPNNKKKETNEASPESKPTPSPDPASATEIHPSDSQPTTSKKSFLETYQPSFHGLRRSIIDFIYPPSEESVTSKKEDEKEATHGKISSRKLISSDSENEPSISPIKSYQNSHNIEQRKYSEKKYSEAYDSSDNNESNVEVHRQSTREHKTSGQTSDFKINQPSREQNVSEQLIGSQQASGVMNEQKLSTMKEQKPSDQLTPSISNRVSYLSPPPKSSFSERRTNEVSSKKVSNTFLESAPYSEKKGSDCHIGKKNVPSNYFEEQLLYNENFNIQGETDRQVNIDNGMLTISNDQRQIRNEEDLEEEMITFSDQKQRRKSEDRVINERRISFVEQRSSFMGNKPTLRDSNTSPFVMVSPTVNRKFSKNSDQEYIPKKTIKKSSDEVLAKNTSTPISKHLFSIDEDTISIDVSPDGGKTKVFSYSKSSIPARYSQDVDLDETGPIGSLPPSKIYTFSNKSVQDTSGKFLKDIIMDEIEPMENRSKVYTLSNKSLPATPKSSKNVSLSFTVPKESVRSSKMFPFSDKSIQGSSCTFSKDNDFEETEPIGNIPTSKVFSSSSNKHFVEEPSQHLFSVSNKSVEVVPSKMSRSVSCDIKEQPSNMQPTSVYSNKSVEVSPSMYSRGASAQNFLDTLKYELQEPARRKGSSKNSIMSLRRPGSPGQNVTYLKESPRSGKCSKICSGSDDSPVLEISPVTLVNCAPLKEKQKSKSSAPLSGFFLKKSKKMKITVQYSDDEHKDSSDESSQSETFSVQEDSDEYTTASRPCSRCKKKQAKPCKCCHARHPKLKSEPFKHHGIYSCNDKLMLPANETDYRERAIRTGGKSSLHKGDKFSFEKMLQRNPVWGHQKSVYGLDCGPGDKDYLETGLGLSSFKYSGTRVDPFLAQHMYSSKVSSTCLPHDVGIYLSQHRKLYCNNNRSQDSQSDEGSDIAQELGQKVDKLDLVLDVPNEPGINTSIDKVQSFSHSKQNVFSENIPMATDDQTKLNPVNEAPDREMRDYFYTETVSSACSLHNCIQKDKTNNSANMAKPDDGIDIAPLHPSKPFITFRGPSLYKHLSQIHFSEKSNRYEWVKGSECFSKGYATNLYNYLTELRVIHAHAQGSNKTMCADGEMSDKSPDSGHHSLSGGYQDGMDLGLANNNYNNNRDSHLPEWHRPEEMVSKDPVVRKLNFEDTSLFKSVQASPDLERTLNFGQDEVEISHNGEMELRSELLHKTSCARDMSYNFQNFEELPDIDYADYILLTKNVNSSELLESNHPNLADYFNDISTIVVDSDEEGGIINNRTENVMCLVDRVENSSCPETVKKKDEKINSKENLLKQKLSVDLENHLDTLPMDEFTLFNPYRSTHCDKDWSKNAPKNGGNVVFHKWPEIYEKLADQLPAVEGSFTVKSIQNENQKSVYSCLDNLIDKNDCVENQMSERDSEYSSQHLICAKRKNESSVAYDQSCPPGGLLQVLQATGFNSQPPQPCDMQGDFSNSLSEVRSIIVDESSSSACNQLQEVGTKVPDWLDEEVLGIPENLFNESIPSPDGQEIQDVSETLWEDNVRPQLSPATRLYRLLIQSQEMINLLEHSPAIPESVQIEVSTSHKQP
nr:coiled-coil domain-containing protein 62-like isoform X2 [Biomphalaria glabrata]